MSESDKQVEASGGVRRDALSDWAGIGKLEVHFADNPDATEGQICRNGVNQVRVQIKVQPIDSSGNWIPYDDALAQKIFNQLYVVDQSQPSQHLTWTEYDWVATGSNWAYTIVRNNYVTMPSGGAVQAFVRGKPMAGARKYDHGDQGTIDFIYYLLCPHDEALSSISIAALIEQVPDGYGNYRNIDSAGNTSNIPLSCVSLKANEPGDVDIGTWQANGTYEAWSGSGNCNGDDKNWFYVYTWNLPDWLTVQQNHSYQWVGGEDWLNNTYFQIGQPYQGSYLWMAGGRIHPPGSTLSGVYAGCNDRYQNYPIYLDTYYWYRGFSCDMLPTVSTPANQIKVSWFVTGDYSFMTDGYEDGNFYYQPDGRGNSSRFESHRVAIVDIYGTMRWFKVPPYNSAYQPDFPQIQYDGIDWGGPSDLMVINAAEEK